MRSTLCATILALAVSISLAGDPPKDVKSSPMFDKLKSLAGTWTGKDSEGKPYTITYKVVSAGTAVMETLDMAENEAAMITMYHPDGAKVMMTHYCSMGNQPRMKASALSKDGKTLTFTFVDVTNRANPKDNYMKGLVFTFKDDTHFSQQWTMRMEGKTDHPDLFEYQRMAQ